MPGVESRGNYVIESGSFQRTDGRKLLEGGRALLYSCLLFCEQQKEEKRETGGKERIST